MGTVGDPLAAAISAAGYADAASGLILCVSEDKDYGIAAALLREMVGNRFRVMTANSAWPTSTVTSLAQALYTDRAFDRMPIIADALEDAGCSNQDILQHCRSGGKHVRGCWVADLLLGKE